MQKIANKLGYQGSLDNFENYLEQNPEKKRQMIVYEDAAKQMARGGVVKMQTGGAPTQSTPSFTPAGQAPVTTLGEGEGQVPAYSGDIIARCYRNIITDRCYTCWCSYTTTTNTCNARTNDIQPDRSLGTTPTAPTATAITAQQMLQHKLPQLKWKHRQVTPASTRLQ